MRDDLRELSESWPTDVPFERAVRKHLGALRRLNDEGLTWKAVAAALTSAGVRKKDGSLMSSRQMNTVFTRVWKSAARNGGYDGVVTTLEAATAIEVFTGPSPSRPHRDETERKTFDLRAPVGTKESASRSSSNPELARRLDEAFRLSTRKREGFEE